MREPPARGERREIAGIPGWGIGSSRVPDPGLSPSENAQRYFKEYKRARDASRRVPELVAVADRELSYLADMDTLVRIADEPSRIRSLREERRHAL